MDLIIILPGGFALHMESDVIFCSRSCQHPLQRHSEVLWLQKSLRLLKADYFGYLELAGYNGKCKEVQWIQQSDFWYEPNIMHLSNALWKFPLSLCHKWTLSSPCSTSLVTSTMQWFFQKNCRLQHKKKVQFSVEECELLYCYPVKQMWSLWHEGSARPSVYDCL